MIFSYIFLYTNRTVDIPIWRICKLEKLDSFLHMWCTVTYCGTNNRASRWTFTDPCKPEVRSGAREESASPAWLAAPAMNARDTTKVYIWRLDTGCGPTLYRKCHSHNKPGIRHSNTWVEPIWKGSKMSWITSHTKLHNWRCESTSCFSKVNTARFFRSLNEHGK